MIDRREFCQVVTGAAVSASAKLAPGQSDTEQKEALELMLRVLTPTRPPMTGRINAVDRTWEQWQRRTGELPPKFSALPTQPFLPDPLEGIRLPEQWPERRQQIRRQMEHWLIGKMPPAPHNLRAVVTADREEDGLRVRDVRLEFGPGWRATLRLQLLIPPHSGPLPVFLTNHGRWWPWTATAVARGYMGVIYSAGDPVFGGEDDSDKLIDIYPEYDFSCLARWSWSASRAVDYLLTLPEVDKDRIAISGHSRNGKASLLVAACDERIAAAIPSSGNTGECNPWRFTSDNFATETLEQITTIFPHWFHPRMRFFAGREDKLPFDQNSVMSLIAPRPLLMAANYTEGSSFLGIEQNYNSVRKVYEFLGKPDNLHMRFRASYHMTTAGDIEAYIDFLDNAFGRASISGPAANPVFGYSFENWKAQSGQSSSIQPNGDKLEWALGPEPPQLKYPAGYATQVRFGDSVLPAPGLYEFLFQPVKSEKMKLMRVPFGADLRADLYLPLQHQGKLPLVVWLHPFAGAGYVMYESNIHEQRINATFEELTRRGYAVLAFDQIGYGTRVEYAKDFYRRYPKWSLLGKMIADTKAAVSAALALDMIDDSKVYLLGYALGSKVALWTSAFDPRPAGIVAIAGVTRLRTSKDIEGIYSYSHLHGLLPRLGFYLDQPVTVPVDYDDVFERLRNRKVLLLAPAHDRFADVPGLRKMISRFKNVEMVTLDDFNRFSPTVQTQAFDWIDQLRAAG